MNKKIIQEIKNTVILNFYSIICSLIIINNASLLLYNHNFFIWPPSWSLIINNYIFDMAILVAGILLLIIQFINVDKIARSLIYGINAGFLIFLIFEAILHAMHWNSYFLFTSVFFMIGILIILIKEAYNNKY